MDYKKLAYEALQRVSVSTTLSEGAIQRVADYLETTLKNTSSNSDYAKCIEDEDEESIWDNDSWVDDPELGCQG